MSYPGFPDRARATGLKCEEKAEFPRDGGFWSHLNQITEVALGILRRTQPTPIKVSVTWWP